MESLRIRMLTVVLDCADVHELADFYAALLGWTKDERNPEWIGVSEPGTLPYILFQPVEDYQPPVWPDAPHAQRQMMHLDFAVNDMDLAIAHALRLGARLAPEQFSDHWTVLIDPAGHPFCFCRMDG